MDRQHHDGQREGTGDQAVAPFELHDKEQHTEQTVYDGGDALQRFGGDAHHLDQLAAAFGVFHQPDRSKNAQRCGNGQRERRHQNGIDKRGHQGYVVGIIGPLKQGRLEVGNTVDQDIADQEHKDRHSNQGRQPHQPAHDKGIRAGRHAVFVAGGGNDFRICVGHIIGFTGGCSKISHSFRPPLPN